MPLDLLPVKRHDLEICGEHCEASSKFLLKEASLSHFLKVLLIDSLQLKVHKPLQGLPQLQRNVNPEPCSFLGIPHKVTVEAQTGTTLKGLSSS